jgi:acyl dehydratase
MSSLETVRAALQARLGQANTSDWHTITQQQINAFADATLDHQWIHVDEARAKRESPLSPPGQGTTVAHGFLTISLLSHFMESALQLPPVRAGVNYGCDKLRFVSPVPVGSRVRGVMTLKEVTEHLPMLQLRWDVVIEREGSDKPAVIAEWLTRILP